jgi:hypothetical protein
VHERPVRHLPVAAIVVTMLVAATIVLYRSGLIAGMTAAFGSTTIVLIVLAHLGALAAIGTCLVALRRLPRRNHRK